MLSNLYIKNFALIDECHIEFDKKINILSGETGSGKSVILDSINFVLGSKADKTMIRHGCNDASVRAEFCLPDNSAVYEVLSELDIDCEDGLIIVSRKMSVDGKNNIRINGIPATAGMLKKISSKLVDVHGQSEHFFLLNEANQLAVIDKLCPQTLVDLKNSLLEKINKKNECKKRILSLGGSEQEREQKLDILTYQIDEIEKAQVKEGEIEQLKSRKKLLDNAEKLLQAIGGAKSILSDDNGSIETLQGAKRQISSIIDMGDDFAEIADRLENVLIEVEDIADTLADKLDNFTFDAVEAEHIEERLAVYKNLCKKYGSTELEILNFLENAKTKYDDLIDSAEQLVKLNSQISCLDGEIFEVCKNITSIRKATCKSFCEKVVEQLKTLNIPQAQFYVDFNEYSDGDAVTHNGADKICFMFSANRGEPSKPLNKVISGGEMSRFMLAVKTILKSVNGIETYIFDEIDAGISGVTAKSVADKFVKISESTQIIAVSHLPQVCACASSQFLISKSDNNSKTVTTVKKLEREERVGEIVRLTGGIYTQSAKQHAEELLKQFNN